MADPKLVQLIAQGREAWNEWQSSNQREHGVSLLDLSGADLRNRDLVGFDFSYVNLSDADLSGANLSGVLLAHANANNASLTRVTIVDSTFRFTSFYQANFTRVQAEECRFHHVFFDNANLAEAEFRYCNFTQASFDNATFRESLLFNVLFWTASFKGTDFAEARLSETLFAGSIFADAVGLEDIKHLGPSSLDAHTVIRTHDLPAVFLRGIGLPDTLIAYYKSLAASASPIQFYSTFISYSSGDEEFCRRLHNDLQAAGVRCWFATEDLKIGDRFRDRIEESIRVYDKLLVVLSEHSINSQWVPDEIEAALEKERHRNTTVLFPIRLNDAVMKTNQAWAASIRRSRHIGDFTGWKDHDAYKRAFDRLMRDLRAGETKSSEFAE